MMRSMATYRFVLVSVYGMRNFKCPMTEEPCENERCRRDACAEQVLTSNQQKADRAAPILRDLQQRWMFSRLFPGQEYPLDENRRLRAPATK